MALVLRKCLYSKPEIRIIDLTKTIRLDFIRGSSTENVEQTEKSPDRYSSTKNINEIKSSTDSQEFRVLQLYPRKDVKTKRAPKVYEKKVPRTAKMTPDMDWTNIWPAPKTFHPATVPLPLHQGFNKIGPPPFKYANTELMKIPNFLHLTPPAIEKHCNALKKFCTKWPENLNTDEDIEKHFPVEIISSDYCHSSSSIRDPKARIISLRIKLKNLELDEHSKDKFLRIVGPRYDPETDYVTITTDSCPIKKQNYDYAYYLLTAVYFESWKFEEWEKDKSEDDMETYIFEERQSFRSVKAFFDYSKKELPEIKEYKKAVEDWINQGDDLTSINKYKEAAMKLLSLPPLET